MNWTQLEIFKGIDLNDSFVEHWSCKNSCLVFDLEASIWPESKYYTKPLKDEYTCYRKASLTFCGIHSIIGLLPIESVQESKDLDGSIDYGNIEELNKTHDGFKLVGEFGDVKIKGGELCFEIHT